MSIQIGRYSFDGPYTATDPLLDRSGVYALLDVQPTATHVVDIGESATVKTRIEGHDRKDCWKRNTSGRLQVAVLYTLHADQSARMQIEQELRGQYRPPCGDR